MNQKLVQSQNQPLVVYKSDNMASNFNIRKAINSLLRQPRRARVTKRFKLNEGFANLLRSVIYLYGKGSRQINFKTRRNSTQPFLIKEKESDNKIEEISSENSGENNQNSSKKNEINIPTVEDASSSDDSKDNNINNELSSVPKIKNEISEADIVKIDLTVDESIPSENNSLQMVQKGRNRHIPFENQLLRNRLRLTFKISNFPLRKGINNVREPIKIVFDLDQNQLIELRNRLIDKEKEEEKVKNLLTFPQQQSVTQLIEITDEIDGINIIKNESIELLSPLPNPNPNPPIELVTNKTNLNGNKSDIDPIPKDKPEITNPLTDPNINLNNPDDDGNKKGADENKEGLNNKGSDEGNGGKIILGIFGAAIIIGLGFSGIFFFLKKN